MEEQLNLFSEVKNTELDLYEHIEPILNSVLDENMISHRHVKLNQNKKYYAVLFRNMVLFSYNFSSKNNWVSFSNRYKALIPASLGKQKEKNSKIKIYIDSIDDLFKFDYFWQDILNEAIDNFPKSFGCCSRYIECSNAKKCVNPDKELALDCSYKINLKHGRIFYGYNAIQKNKQ